MMFSTFQMNSETMLGLKEDRCATTWPETTPEQQTDKQTNLHRRRNSENDNAVFVMDIFFLQHHHRRQQVPIRAFPIRWWSMGTNCWQRVGFRTPCGATRYTESSAARASFSLVCCACGRQKCVSCRCGIREVSLCTYST